MKYEILEEEQFKYIETNKSSEHILLLLHGLFGALSNFESIIDHFGNKMNVVVPLLPIFELPLRKVSISGLLKYVVDFVDYKNFDSVNVLGNSLGGHIALMYVLEKPNNTNSLILTGSSGLFENAMGSTFPKRGNYEFIKAKTESTFYDPNTATKELVDEVFDIVNDRNKAIRIIATAKSAIRHNLENKLDSIKTPTLLIWGKEDSITPSFVGERFKDLIQNSELILMEKCGHAPMMEQSTLFNKHLADFLDQKDFRA